MIDAENTTIIQGAGSKSAIEGRAEQIRREITRPTANTTARSCKNGWRNSPAAWPRSTSEPRPKRR